MVAVVLLEDAVDVLDSWTDPGDSVDVSAAIAVLEGVLIAVLFTIGSVDVTASGIALVVLNSVAVVVTSGAELVGVVDTIVTILNVVCPC